MNRISILQRLKLLTVVLATLLTSGNLFATHAQSADITYQCLGGNQYQIQVSFYRDCAGVAAPNTVSVNLSSASCSQNFNATLNKIPGTGIDVTQVCNTINTQCNGGTYPGVQEYIYQSVVTLPAQCTDWVFSFSLCCRNNAINTINTPGSENIYVEAELNNLDFPCNSSPSFSNPPVSYPCIGQTSCFNHGAIDVDGDSLYYSLLPPATSATTTVTYVAGYSATQPLISSPLISFNPNTGDICMTPTLLEVTVLAVRVEEWRNGVFVGSVIRDIQLRTVLCNNTLPTVSGIDGTGQFSTTACVGSNLSFTIPSQDVDAGQTVTLTWNNAISGATFTSNNLQIPTATFSWTPTLTDVSTVPYCFTVQVKDNNCPLNGVQVYSFCITVSALNITTSSTTANCGASNGSATVSVLNGTAPYTYQWSPSGGNNATANGLLAGNYTVLVTDAAGCSASQTVTIGSGAAPGNVIISSTNVTCFSANNGTALANANGGQQPYTYLWSNGVTTDFIQNLAPGIYQVTVTTANGCVTIASVTITEPLLPLTAAISTTPVTCFGGNNGTATIVASGGTLPYQYSWNTTPIQTTSTANNLTANNYSVTVVDANGCSTVGEIMVTQPSALSLTLLNQQNVTCFGVNDGVLSVNVNGGTAPYQYNWNSGSLPNTATINNLTSGNYNLIVVDANGCTQSVNYAITEPTLLNTVVSNQTDINCYGLTNGSITSITTGGTTPYTYLWSNGGTTPDINTLSVGTYNLLATDANGCTNTLSVNITAPSSPLTSTISTTPVNCFGENNGTATVLAFGGTPPYQYSWNTTPIQTTPTANNLTANNYSVTITDANGCLTVGNGIVTQPTSLSLTLLNQQNVSCFGVNDGGVSVNVNGGTAPYQYSWNGGSLPNTATVSNLSPGNYNLNLIDANGCSLTASYSISEPIVLTNVISTQQNISCYGLTNGTLTTTATGGTTPYTYQWSNGATTSTVNNLGIGTYYSWVTDANGCSSVTSTNITQPAVISTTVSNNVMICPNEQTTLQAFSTGGTGILTYQWSNGLSGQNAIVSPTSETTYQVYSIDENGCVGNTATTIVSVNDINLALLDVFGDDAICVGEIAEVYATFKPGLGTYTFAWDNGLGTSLIPIGVSPNTTTNYTITVTDDCGNTLSDGALIEVHPLPEVGLPPQTAMDCGEVNFNFQNNFGNPSGSTYNWNFGDNSFSTNQTSIKTYSQTGSYTVTLIVTTPFGCTDLATTTINAVVNPVARAGFDFTPDEELNANNATLYFTNYSTNTSVYKWNFGDGGTSTIAEPVHTYLDKGEYIITLITNNNFNCADTLSRVIKVDPAYNFYIPNAFTPDKDGLNEIFTAVGEEIKEFSMQIFNRWGEKIYETHDLAKGWDGKAKDGSEIAQQDVYVYDIRLRDFTGKLHTMQGKVTLIK
ncbi:MAG: gliding motility-associated C-terminal domain-containing protein [Bacteroidetes bacterium]|nr:gliding motility-associated C-terminal domain-containing protein [Bacteroidota bacterium]